jgi:hypothetical protein
VPQGGHHERQAMTEKAGSPAHPPRPTQRGRRTPANPGLVCPKCQGVMRTYVRGGIVVELCEDCRGIFLDKGELERLIDVEGGGWSGILAAPSDPTG